MLGTDGAAKADRSEPVAGDLRLLVTLVKDKPRAVLYRARVPGTKAPGPIQQPLADDHARLGGGHYRQRQRWRPAATETSN